MVALNSIVYDLCSYNNYGFHIPNFFPGQKLLYLFIRLLLSYPTKMPPLAITGWIDCILSFIDSQSKLGSLNLELFDTCYSCCRWKGFTALVGSKKFSGRSSTALILLFELGFFEINGNVDAVTSLPVLLKSAFCTIRYTVWKVKEHGQNSNPVKANYAMKPDLEVYRNEVSQSNWRKAQLDIFSALKFRLNNCFCFFQASSSCAIQYASTIYYTSVFFLGDTKYR